MLKQQCVLKRNLLFEEFNKIFDYPLTLAVAAMGYGKTTAARDFLDETGVKYVWLSIESDETSPQYIWDSLTRQLSKAIPELGSQLCTLGFPVDMPQRDKVLKIIEDQTYLTTTVLVIDDYHFSYSSEFDRLIERIVRTNIDGLHILLLSRTVPEMNIEELKLKGYCHVIKSILFEVNKNEIKEFFKLYGYDISEEVAGKIYVMSEGWVAAVYLIMQRYAEIGRLEMVSSIERLIETAVMSRYTEREIHILKLLSVLDHFTPQQAVYITNDTNTEKMIQKLSYGNSFIRYDAFEGVYRIHNIFSNYLKKLIEDQLFNLELEVIYKRAGQWYINHENIIPGLKYFLKAKEYDLIMEQFEKNSINVVLDRSPGYILELFNSIPIEAKYRHPIGFLAFIGFYVTNVDKENGAVLLKQIQQYYENHNNISTGLKERISGEIELIRAYIGFNDAALMRERLIKAHGTLKGSSFIANKDKIITFGSPHSLYLYYREKGQLLWVRDCVEEMFFYYMEMADGCGKGFDSLLHAEYHLETGNLKEAELHAYKAIYKAKSLEQVSVMICAQFVLARASAAKGKFDEAVEIMDDLSEEVDACNSPILSSAYDLCAGYISGILKKETGFAKWLGSGDMKQSEVLYQGMGFNHIIYGKYLLLKKQYIELEVLCEEMRGIFSAFNNLLGYLHTFILDAAAKYELYGMENAKPAMKAALDIGKSDNIVMPFSEYSVYILDILKQFQKDEEPEDFLNRLVDCTSQYGINLKNFKGEESANPVLTNREKEILKLVVEGETNREISEKLFVAEITVRKNLTSIYRKLNVNGRALAVKKAIEMKII